MYDFIIMLPVARNLSVFDAHGIVPIGSLIALSLPQPELELGRETLEATLKEMIFEV